MKEGILGIIIAIGGSLLTASGYTLQKIAHKRAERSLSGTEHARRRSAGTPGGHRLPSQDVTDLSDGAAQPHGAAGAASASAPAAPSSESPADPSRPESAPTLVESPVTVIEVSSPTTSSGHSDAMSMCGLSASTVPHRDAQLSGNCSGALAAAALTVTALDHACASSGTSGATASSEPQVTVSSCGDADSEAARRATPLAAAGSVTHMSRSPPTAAAAAPVGTVTADSSVSLFRAVSTSSTARNAATARSSVQNNGCTTPSPSQFASEQLPGIDADGSVVAGSKVDVLVDPQPPAAAGPHAEQAAAVADGVQAEAALSGQAQAAAAASPQPDSAAVPAQALPIPYWRFWQLWAGLLLLLIGSIVSVVTYGLASQAQLAPMSALTLLFNEVLAWLVLKERLGWVDFVACALMAAGVTVALVFQRSTEKDYSTVSEVADLLDRPEVYAYVGSVAAAIIIMSFLVGRWGRWRVSQLRPVTAAADAFCRSAVAGLLGGFTGFLVGALAGIVFPAVGDGDWSVFGSWAIWGAIALVAVVAMNQVRFMNAGLSRYDSNRIIPIYQSALVLAGVASGLILWNDASVQTPLSASTFAGGCAINVCGVALLALKPRHAAAATAPMPADATALTAGEGQAQAAAEGAGEGIELPSISPATPTAAEGSASPAAAGLCTDVAAPWPEPAPRNSATGALIEALEVAVAAAAGTALDPDLTQATLDAAELEPAAMLGLSVGATPVATPGGKTIAQRRQHASSAHAEDNADHPGHRPGRVLRRRFPSTLSPVRESGDRAAILEETAATPLSVDSSPRSTSSDHTASAERAPLTRSARGQAQAGSAAQAAGHSARASPATSAAKLLQKAVVVGSVAANRLVSSARHGAPAEDAAAGGPGRPHRRAQTWAGQK